MHYHDGDTERRCVDFHAVLANKQLESLAESLNQRTEELLNIRRDNSSLENKLTVKTQELILAIDNNKTTTDLYNTLMAKNEELLQKMQQEKETFNLTMETYQHEMDALRKLTELYKRVSEEEKTKYAEELAVESHSMQVLHTNMALIKAALERTLTSSHRECAALRPRLQEQSENFRQFSAHLELQMKNARMKDEKKIAEKREELAKKLKHPTMSAAGLDGEGKKYRELEKMLADKQLEVDGLREKLTMAKEVEKQLDEVVGHQEQYKKKVEKKLSSQANQLATLHTTCEDLRADSQTTTTNLNQRLAQLQLQHGLVSTALAAAQAQLALVQDDLAKASGKLVAAQEKYSREVELHSEDLQRERGVKERLDRVEMELRERMGEDWERREGIMVREREEVEKKSSDQLLKIIKYLGQEKVIALSKAEIIESGQMQMNTQLETVQRDLAEVRTALKTERQNTDVSSVSGALYAEVLRSMETINAITDSNRTLRTERDGLRAAAASSSRQDKQPNYAEPEEKKPPSPAAKRVAVSDESDASEPPSDEDDPSEKEYSSKKAKPVKTRKLPPKKKKSGGGGGGGGGSESDSDEDRAKTKKPAKKAGGAKAGDGGGGKGHTKSLTLSPELASLVGQESMTRHEVTRKVWSIIKEKNLYDPKDKRFAICDDALLKVFGVKRFRAITMGKYLKDHFIS